MPDRILIAVAWPYVNGPPHLGHIAGMSLPADIFARFHRMIGNDVLMVSGSDMHGTPTALRAQEEGVGPDEVAFRYHRIFEDVFKRFNFSYDLYTTTETSNHHRVAQTIFSKLLKNGYLYEATHQMPFCEQEQRFLSDRFVEGTCPHCGYTEARGDQCDRCGNTLDPVDLIDIRCKADGSTPVFRDTSHYLFKLSALQERLEAWVGGQEHWRAQVKNMTEGMLRSGLPDRAITRDIQWGVPVPVEGYEHKRIYVWFEALIGYLSASMEWAQLQGRPDAWEPWWLDPDAASYYFMGKDNIPFHTLIWPGMLMGVEDPPYNLPYDVPANEFLNLEGRAFSTSRNWAIWADDVLSRYDTDALRYYLAAIMPESSDSDFRWASFVSRNNDELVATLGNFIHRVLTLTHRNFRGVVPERGDLDAEDDAALAACETALKETREHLLKTRFRDGLWSMMNLAQTGNRYVDSKAPWQTIKTDRKRTATTLWTALNLVSTLRTLCYPFLPDSAQRMHEMLGQTDEVLSVGWQSAPPRVGQQLPSPRALFKKLDESIAEEELARLQSPANR